MKRTSYILALLAGASALLLSSCAKQSGYGVDAPLSFSTDTPELVEVKAAAVTSVSDFYAMGYGTTQWFPTSGGPQRVLLSGGSQTFGTYKWKMGDTKTFFAYSNNVPGGATATIASSGVTLTYTAIPTEASAQTDVTLGRYTGNGSNTGTAAMTFYHPLAQVVFKMGDMAGVSKINKIEISGVYNAGTTTLGTTTETTSVPAASGSGNVLVADFSWTGTSGSAKVSQTVNSLPATGDEIGIPFMLIPQDLATQNVTVTVTVTTIGGSSVNLTTKLESGTFATGKKTVCTLTVNPARELGCNLTVYTADTGDDIFETFPGPKPNEIWYTTTDGQIITKTTCLDNDDDGVVLADKTYEHFFGVDLVSNKYDGDHGVMKFSGPVKFVEKYAFACHTEQYSKTPNDDSHISQLLTITFPEGVERIGSDIFCGYKKPNVGTGTGIYCNLELVTIPLSVTSLGNIVYRACNPGIKIGIESDKIYYADTSDSNWSYGPITLGNGTVYNNMHICCFAKGTLITMADGSKKPVEELEYGDVLKVWNFDEGHEDSADILWITKRGIKMPYYFKCTFSDGTVLNVIGEDGGGTHRIFDTTKGSFEHPHTIPVDDEIYTDNGLVKLVSYERIDEEVEYFNLITTKHINCYANDVLTSARYNNRWPIDEDMKFVKDGRKIRPYREFKKAGISREWYEGMRLGEQQDSIARVKAYIDRCEHNTRPRPESDAPQGFFARIWNWIKGLFSK